MTKPIDEFAGKGGAYVRVNGVRAPADRAVTPPPPPPENDPADEQPEPAPPLQTRPAGRLFSR